MEKTKNLISLLKGLDTSKMYNDDFLLTWEKSDEEVRATFAVADILNEKAGASVRSIPCNEPSKREICVGFSPSGKVSGSTVKPWFWLVIITLPVLRSCTGWLVP